ncbi:MAG: DUF420 domain-containing protein [Gammaproteobacteria bacterium]|nr:DUF420 domain-containing protein [Gammaproteobacteria bacterium]
MVWGVIALTLLIVAWRMAVTGNIHRHKQIMIFLTIGAWMFVANYLLAYEEGTMPKVPPELIVWLSIHGTVAMFPIVGALVLIFARLKAHLRSSKIHHINHYHRIYGRVLVVLWVFTHLGGFVNYFLFT